MRKVETAHCEARKEEIINACLELYQSLSFKDITIKDIAEYTTFSRPSIYNYFETKEEIFLAIFQKEYENWKTDLDKIAKKKEKLSAKQFANKLSKSLENRVMLLKLLSMNQFDMEEHSRLERLVEFKKAYGDSVLALTNALKRAFPSYNKTKCENFVSAFIPFMMGIYPCVFVSKKQNKAMLKAGINYKLQSISELTNRVVLSLLEK